MTHYYYYFMAGAVCDSTTQLFKVSLGNSAQGRRDFLFLTAHAVQHGHYFEIVSDKSSDFALNLQNSLAADGVQVDTITGRELVRYIKYGYRPTLDNRHLKCAAQQRYFLDANYRAMSNLRKLRVTSANAATL